MWYLVQMRLYRGAVVFLGLPTKYIFLLSRPLASGSTVPLHSFLWGNGDNLTASYHQQRIQQTNPLAWMEVVDDGHALNKHLHRIPALIDKMNVVPS